MEPNMGIAFSVVTIVILSVSVLLFHRSRETTNKRRAVSRRPGKAQPDPKFHAVSLDFSGNSCEAAKAIKGERILASTAPRIPLSECDVPECKCRFIHHQDRRQAADRRSPYHQSNIGETGKHQKERRHRGDRRNEDPQDFFL